MAHKILKEKHSEGALQLRDSCLPSSQALDRLIGEIHTAYAERSGKSHGIFEVDEVNYPTAANLRKHFQEQTVDFVATSHALMQILLTKANEASSNLRDWRERPYRRREQQRDTMAHRYDSDR
ncbi:MAG: nucleoid-associated protein [Candidatus Thiodiazotropha sp. (ex Epidulcina cf. delphinae)]|nr:nucleoid-associated protein [Candidatus Thiodiazotropha sp. (ex Epidulcina cf. delphinae)]